LRKGLLTALGELFQRFLECFLPREKQTALPLNQIGMISVGFGRGHQFLGKADLLGVIALSLKPPAPGEDLEELPLDDRIFRAKQLAIEHDQRITCRNAIPVFDIDLRHHPAIGMLHDLAILFDLHPPSRDNGARDRGEAGPEAEAENQECDGEEPCHQRPLG